MRRKRAEQRIAEFKRAYEIGQFDMLDILWHDDSSIIGEEAKELIAVLMDAMLEESKVNGTPLERDWYEDSV